VQICTTGPGRTIACITMGHQRHPVVQSYTTCSGPNTARTALNQKAVLLAQGTLLRVDPSSTKLYYCLRADYCTYAPAVKSYTTGSGRTIALTPPRVPASLESLPSIRSSYLPPPTVASPTLRNPCAQGESYGRRRTYQVQQKSAATCPNRQPRPSPSRSGAQDGS
jgi:hypothetical protein